MICSLCSTRRSPQLHRQGPAASLVSEPVGTDEKKRHAFSDRAI